MHPEDVRVQSSPLVKKKPVTCFFKSPLILGFPFHLLFLTVLLLGKSGVLGGDCIPAVSFSMIIWSLHFLQIGSWTQRLYETHLIPLARLQVVSALPSPMGLSAR